MSCIIYGYDSFDTLPTNTQIILIEPRKLVIDKFKLNIKNSDKKIILITKSLSEKDTMIENTLSYDKNKCLYYIDLEYHENCEREKTYTTSLINIINDYNIQNIESLFFNINVSNINNILSSIKSVNHIISNIYFKSCVDRSIYETNNILKLFTRQKELAKPLLDDWVLYTHKNLNIELPKICMFFTKNNIISSHIKLLQFIKKYKIDVLLNDEIIEWNNLENKNFLNSEINKILYNKYLLQKLDIIYKSDKKYDIIIGFNENILDHNKNFYILYPVNDDTLYINKQFDIIYSSNNAMFMLYQILSSTYFNDWIHEQALKKPNLVKFFIKKWFYEYIYKTFKIININTT